MKSLIDLGPNECRFALTTSEKSDRSWSHVRLGDSGQGAGAHPHMFCGAPTKPGEPYCAAHRKLCWRGPGKDPMALAGMIDALDQQVVRAIQVPDNTEPLDVETRREVMA